MGVLASINLFISSFDMKCFLKKILLYIVIVLLIAVPIDIFKMHLQKHGVRILGTPKTGLEVFCAIGNSQKVGKVKKLLLGDSVGCQLYPCDKEYESIMSLACNQAITMARHFFLLKNYIETNVEDLPEEVILLITPFSLPNDVDEYAYNYFLKPFPPYTYSEQYTKHLKQRIHSIPYFWTANLPFVRTSSYTPELAIPSIESIKGISELSYEYLLKMDSIANVNNIVFRMVSTPIRDDMQNDIASFWENFPTEYMSRLSNLLQPYKKSIIYLPSDWYFDKVHFIKEKVPNDYLNLLSE